MDEQAARELADLVETALDNEIEMGYVLEHVLWRLDTLAGNPHPRGVRSLTEQGQLL